MRVTIDITEEELKTITTFVDVLKKATGVDSQPLKPNKKEIIKIAASKMALGERLTKADLKELNNI